MKTTTRKVANYFLRRIIIHRSNRFVPRVPIPCFGLQWGFRERHISYYFLLTKQTKQSKSPIIPVTYTQEWFFQSSFYFPYIYIYIIRSDKKKKTIHFVRIYKYIWFLRSFRQIIIITVVFNIFLVCSYQTVISRLYT